MQEHKIIVKKERRNSIDKNVLAGNGKKSIILQKELKDSLNKVGLQAKPRTLETKL